MYTTLDSQEDHWKQWRQNYKEPRSYCCWGYMGEELLFFSSDLLEFLPGSSGSASAPPAPWSKHQAVCQEAYYQSKTNTFCLCLSASVHVGSLWDWWGFRGTHLAASPHLLSLCSINQMTCFLPSAFKIANWPLSERGFQLGLIFSFYKK